MSNMPSMCVSLMLVIILTLVTLGTVSFVLRMVDLLYEMSVREWMAKQPDLACTRTGLHHEKIGHCDAY